MTDPKNSTTTKNAADAKVREGRTGSSHDGVNKVMKDMDKADRPAKEPSPTPGPKKE